jgi:polysaccharide pyruvyl transferase WcaK-like protein
MKIGVTGLFGCGNPGDELILQNFLNLHKKDKVTIFPPKETYKIPESDIQVLYFPGGGVFYDVWIQNYFPEHLMKKINIPIIFLAVGVPHGERKTLLSRRISYFAKKVHFFGFRDPISKHIFQNLWNQPAHIIPDLGYLTEKQQVKRKNTILIQRKGRIPSSYKQVTPKDYNIITEHLFQKILNNFKAKILDWNNFQNAIEEISQASGIICESLHAGIIATTQHTPFSVIQYQEKIRHVLTTVSNSKRIFYPKKDLNPEKIMNFLDFHNSEKLNLEKIKKYLKDVTKEVYNAIRENTLQDLKIIELPYGSIKKESLFTNPLGSNLLINLLLLKQCASDVPFDVSMFAPKRS